MEIIAVAISASISTQNCYAKQHEHTAQYQQRVNHWLLNNVIEEIVRAQHTLLGRM